MAPKPQDPILVAEELKPTAQVLLPTQIVSEVSQAEDGERIVITGMSGLYPQSHSVKELSKILYDKVNPVTAEHSRWNYSHPELSRYAGKAPNLDRFDAQFFKVHFRLGNNMDAMARKLLEQAYQAIYDAGVCPEHLSNKKIAVYIGASFSDSERTSFYDTTTRTGFGITGCSKTMFANRISYWLNVKGPSLTIDEACCSSSTALEQAYLAIRNGDCEAAIVGGCHLGLLPQSSIHYKRIIDMCKDGKTKSFDKNADGCSNSDALNVIFLQKAKDALRVYCEILHVKNEFTGLVSGDTGPKFGFCRIPGTMTNFMKQFYEEAKVPPQAIEYVEAFGSATSDADKNELEAIEEVFLKDRTDPLFIGSVLSNVGFTLAASGVTAVTKVLLRYHTGQIAANLHCTSPRQDVVGLREGRMRVVTEHQPFRRTYVAVNGMSVTGVNSHVLLHGRYKPKDLYQYATNLPRLVALSGRQESGVTKIITDLKSRPIDPEELALLHNIHSSNISGNLGRGYVILDTNENKETVSLCEKSEYFDDLKRPLWFVYSGMGSQWAGMGVQLMRIPIFAAAIERCHRVLSPKGIDLLHIITTPDKNVFDNVLHSFVGIAAIQIGLTDILHELGLKPDGIIGHSVGELGCAYADGCLTVEEMIMCAYSRGLVSLETKLIHGAMAAVGLGYEEVSKLCPPEIAVACHNGPESSTISGPAEKMREFVAELTAKGIFAKEVPSSNIAYHSQYIADAGPGLLKYLKEVIKDPKRRSERWLSTSIPQDRWEEPASKYCSAEYQTNNLLNSVLFDETSRLIPNGAVLVEVAPHGLLQAILKRSLPGDCRNIPLTKRGHPDNVLHLLQAIGNLYTEGYNPQIQALYPKVQFPVSTETPMLSHLVDWVHIEKWCLPSYLSGDKTVAVICKYAISTYDEEYNFLQGHEIRGVTVYPFAAALVAAWDALAMHSGSTRRQLTVQFKDVHLYAQPTLHDQRPLRLVVSMHKGTGWFEVMDNKYKVATGYLVAEKSEDIVAIKNSPIEMMANDLNAQDVYTLLSERDYSYSGEFRSIERASACLSEASLLWRDNWVTLIDGMLQLNMLRQQHDGVTLPTYIRRMCIDVEEHLQSQELNSDNNKNVMRADVYESEDFTRCGGINMFNIKFRNLPAWNQNELKLNLSTVPSNERCSQESMDYDIVQENVSTATKMTLQSSCIGDLNSLRWEEQPDIKCPDVAVTVQYAGLNMIDVKKAENTIPCSDISNVNYGMDFSGTTKSGERVMGLVARGAASSVVRAQPELLWPVPAHWSLEDAATVPLAYAHALYCLKIKTELCPGMSVLIHGGAGALGQAAIAIALAHDCQVFTTVNDIHKKLFLLKLYPQLKEEFIVSSRDNSFEDTVMTATQGKGCNIVIINVKTELKNASLRCCAFNGTVIDTNQIQNRDNYKYGMFYLTKQRSYVATDFSSIFTLQDRREMKLLQTLLSEGISAGYVRPLSRVTYAPHDAARAFRLLATSRHRGRVLLRIQHDAQLVKSKIICSPDACHLLVCDEQPIGMQLAERLVSRGGRKLYIVCPIATPYHLFKIRSWRKLGVDVKLSTYKLNNTGFVKSIINDAANLGSLEGIYVTLKIRDNKTALYVTNLVDNLDYVSRSLCPSLNYFAVITSDSNVGRQTCLSRAKANLPATMLDLSSLTDDTQQACWRNVVNATELALRSSRAVLHAWTSVEQPSDVLQKILEITGLNLWNVDENTSLHELDVTNDKVQVIQSLLRDTYNKSLDEDKILDLTVAEIKDLKEKTKDSFENEVSGLGTFISYVDPDEQLATTDLVPLPTLAKDVIEGDAIESNQTYICIIPGMEGHHERFRVLCERLKLPALVLQPGLDRPHETVRETAERYAQVLLEKIEIQDDFYLLGYETGILIALEVVTILEERGLTGTVFCIGCAPDEIPSMLNEQLNEFTSEEQLQNAILRHMYTLMTGSDTGLDDAIRDATTWEQKADACVRSLVGRMTQSAQYARALVEATLARIFIARSYEENPRALRSRLVLLRAATAHATSASLALQRHSQQPVAVHQLRSSLAHTASDASVPSIVNKYFAADILKQFETKNLCESYLISRDIYMQQIIEDMV